jgi:hypothetical protein
MKMFHLRSVCSAANMMPCKAATAGISSAAAKQAFRSHSFRRARIDATTKT